MDWNLVKPTGTSAEKYVSNDGKLTIQYISVAEAARIIYIIRAYYANMKNNLNSRMAKLCGLYNHNDLFLLVKYNNLPRSLDYTFRISENDYYGCVSYMQFFFIVFFFLVSLYRFRS